MRRFEDLSLREKLVRIIVTVTAIVLLPTAILILFVDFFLLRQATVRGLTVLGDAVAYNISAALAFEDEADAWRVLQSLQAETNVTQAILFDINGEVFSVYRPGEPVDETFPETLDNRWFLIQEKLSHMTPVYEDKNQLGWLLIHYDLRNQQIRLFLYLLLTFGIAGLTLVAAYFLSRVFQKQISGPVLALEHVAREVSSTHDYGMRAVRTTGDEIGSLTVAFNEMLEEIQAKKQALKLSEERLRAAVEASHTGVWDWDLTTGDAIWIGPIFDDLAANPDFSSNRTESILSSVHPDDRHYLEERVRLATARGTFLEADFRVRTKTGGTRNLRSRGQVFRDASGNSVRMIGALIDISDLRAAQAEILDLNRTLEARVQERTLELERAMSEIESFNYSVSHDLRTPLRAISGFSQALLEDYHEKLDPTAQNLLERIIASCHRMGQLIDDLLKLSRLTKHEIRKEPLDLSAMCREIIENLRENHPERKIEVKIEEGLRAEGDPSLIAVALENLLQNAWKFTLNTANPRIEVGQIQEKEGPVFFIRDNGAGFDMAFADSLFGVFNRLHKSTEFEGTGIGLATVQRILERHGGKVWATGALDQGATLYFSIVPNERNHVS